jgi:hypothetical protein
MKKSRISVITIITFFALFHASAQADWLDMTKELYNSAATSVKETFGTDKEVEADKTVELKNVNKESAKQSDGIQEFSHSYDEKMLSKNWEKIVSKVNDILVLAKEKENAPSSTWFGNDKDDIAEDMNNLLDETIGLLNVSGAIEIKKEIKEKQGNIQLLNAEITELNSKKLMAPTNKEDWKVWQTTTSEYESKIIECKNKKQENENRISELKQQILDSLRNIGINATKDEIDTLVYSITGDDDVELITVFNNIKAITIKLKNMIIESGENIETAKRYYGIHLILLKVLLRLQGHYLDNVQYKYIPKIDSIILENDKLINETQKLMLSASQAHKDIYNSNLRAQELTADTAKLYKKFLAMNKARILRSQEQIFREYEVAKNTYDTVSTAHGLIILMRKTDSFYNSLVSLQVPELINFKNDEMKNEFQKLTSQMANK